MKHTDVDETIAYVDDQNRITYILDTELHYSAWYRDTGHWYKKTPDLDGRKGAMLVLCTTGDMNYLNSLDMLKRPAYTVADYEARKNTPAGFKIDVVKPRALRHEFWASKDAVIRTIEKRAKEVAEAEERKADKLAAHTFFTDVMGIPPSTSFSAPIKFNQTEMVALHKEIVRLRALEYRVTHGITR